MQQRSSCWEKKVCSWQSAKLGRPSSAKVCSRSDLTVCRALLPETFLIKTPLLRGTFISPKLFTYSLLRALLIIIHSQCSQGTCCSYLKCKWASELIIHSCEINLYLLQNQLAGGKSVLLCSLLVTRAFSGISLLI